MSLQSKKKKAIVKKTSLPTKLSTPKKDDVILDFIRIMNYVSLHYPKLPKKIRVQYLLILLELDTVDDLPYKETLDARDYRAIEEYIKFRGGIYVLRKKMIGKIKKHIEVSDVLSKLANKYLVSKKEEDWKKFKTEYIKMLV